MLKKRKKPSLIFLDRVRGKILDGSNFSPHCWMYIEVSCICGFEWSLCITKCVCVISESWPESKSRRRPVCVIPRIINGCRCVRPHYLHNSMHYTVFQCVCIMFHLHITNVFMCCSLMVFGLAQSSFKGHCWRRKKSRVRNDYNNRVGGLQADLKQNKDKSLWETEKNSQPDWQTDLLSLSPVSEPVSFRLYAPWTLSRFSVWNLPQWGDCMGPESVKTFLLSLWKTLPAVIRWGEILWVCLPASVCYSGTILLCLFSETVDV